MAIAVLCGALALAVALPAGSARAQQQPAPAGAAKPVSAADMLKPARENEYIIEHTFKLPQGPVYGAFFSPDQKYVVTIGATHSLRLWDAESGRTVKDIRTGEHQAVVGIFHPQEQVIFTGGMDGAVKAWDLTKGTDSLTLEGHAAPVTALLTDNEGGLVFSAARDGKVIVWDVARERPAATIAAHTGPVTALALHPDGQHLATGGRDRTIKIWDWQSGTLVNTLEGHTGSITALHFDTDADTLVSASADATIKFWQWRNREDPNTDTLFDHRRAVTQVALHPNGTWLISSSLDETIKVWDRTTKQVVQELTLVDGPIATFSLSSNGQRIAAAYQKDRARTFATAGADGTVEIWDTATGKVLKTLRGHNGKVNAVAYHPSGAVLASAGSDKAVFLWDVQSGRPIKRIEAHGDQVMTVDFSADGKAFASGSDNGEVKVWSYPEATLQQTLTGHKGGVNEVRFGPRNRMLASAGDDATIKVWSYKDGKLLYDLTGHDFIVTGIRFSVDGKALVSVSRDKTVKLWDMQTGKFIRTVSGERNQIVALAMTRDGRMMATGSIGKNINLMVYPLKVEPAPSVAAEKPAEQPPPEDTTEEAAPESDGSGPVDLAALEAADRERKRLAYRALDSDPDREAAPLEERLNGLLARNDYCRNAEEIDELAHRILLLAPYDMAAYHALVLTGIVQQDLKMIFLMSKIGRQALFLGRVYGYELPQGVEARLAFWQDEVFDPARRRAGRELELEIVDCDGHPRQQSMPSELLAVDIPREVLRVLASRKVRVNFSYFKGLDRDTFLSRLYYLIDEAIAIARRPQGEEGPVTIALEKAPDRKAWLLTLDLSSIDTFGAPQRVPFQLRRERGYWVTYTTDDDRHKALLLPAGNYYLRVQGRVRHVFTMEPQGEVPVVVAQR